MPRISLPLEALDCCHSCGSEDNLTLCTGCSERIYCSNACRNRDRNTHQAACKALKIELGMFFPFLACLYENARQEYLRSNAAAWHPALTHTILNSPDPTAPQLSPSSTWLIRLGSPIEPAEYGQDVAIWWPNGTSYVNRNRLLQRITREGYVVPLTAALCLSLMRSIYGTTSGPDGGRRGAVRLRYGSSPIADFGIASGTVDVPPGGRLSYLLPNGTRLRGQNPDDHHWIYFKTLDGEEVILDCGLDALNLPLCVESKAYAPNYISERLGAVSAYFKDRTMAAHPVLGSIHTERRRISVLRNPMLKRAMEEFVVVQDEVTCTHFARRAVSALLAMVARRPTAPEDTDLCVSAIGDSWMLTWQSIWTGMTFPDVPDVKKVFHGVPEHWQGHLYHP